jgi:hypothetical protein
VEKTIRKVVTKTGADTLVQKVSDTQAILSLGILATPAVTVDGIVKSAGRLPETAKLGSGWGSYRWTLGTAVFLKIGCKNYLRSKPRCLNSRFTMRMESNGQVKRRDYFQW